MPLLDTAKRLNEELEETNKLRAEEAAKLADAASLKARRRALYKEQGAQWFGDLGNAMNDLASNFNSITADKGKHIKIDRQMPGRIAIEFIAPVMRSMIAPTCTVYPVEIELLVKCEYHKPHVIEGQAYTILPTEEGIRVVVKDDGSAKKLNYDVRQFADFVLDSFVNYHW